MAGDRLPKAADVQEMVTAWKLLWKWRRWKPLGRDWSPLSLSRNESSRVASFRSRRSAQSQVSQVHGSYPFQSRHRLRFMRVLHLDQIEVLLPVQFDRKSSPPQADSQAGRWLRRLTRFFRSAVPIVVSAPFPDIHQSQSDILSRSESAIPLEADCTPSCLARWFLVVFLGERFLRYRQRSSERGLK